MKPGQKRLTHDSAGDYGGQVDVTMPRIALVSLALLSLAFGCARTPTKPEPLATTAAIDYQPVWSLDGSTIAFVRRAFSSAGPPGVYVVPSQGGEPRYVAPADIFWPRSLSISPDGKQIACTYFLQVYLLDVASATYGLLLYATNGADHPEWSPDGRYIIYYRLFDQFVPIDSCGFHYIDLLTGQEHPVRPVEPYPYHVPIFYGEDLRWSRDGRSLAWVHSAYPIYNGNAVATANLDGTGYRILDSAEQLQSLHRYVRPSRGMDGLLYGRGSSGMRYMNSDGSGSSPFPFNAHELVSAFSPDGEWVVRVETDLSNNAGVLFVRRVDDITGASRRQLTFLDPPETSDTTAPTLMPADGYLSD